MNTVRGTDRLVILSATHAYKLPRVEAQRALSETKDYYDARGIKGAMDVWRLSADVYQTPKWYAGRGVVANRREARLARAFPEVVERTRTIGAGALNIQRLVEPIVAIDGDEIKDIFARNLDGRIPYFGHTAEQAGNFGVSEDGLVRIVDAGSSNLEKMLHSPSDYGNIVAALYEIGERIQA